MFALAMSLFLQINRQPIKFPLFTLAVDSYLSAFPQQGQDVKKWNRSMFMLLQKTLCMS